MSNSSDQRPHPLVTIVIPTYNRIDLVQQAIASVIAQTYSNWELIVVDDGSDDGTSEAISSLNDPRVRLLNLKHKGNIALLRNTGVKHGSGEWLAFLDSDDIWIPQKLEIQIFQVLREGKRWSYGGYELMNQDLHGIPDKAGKFIPMSGWIIKEVLTTDASVTIGTLMLERSLFEETGGFNEDAELLFREDYELFIRLALKAETWAIPELLVRIREHSGRVTNAFEYGNERTAAVYEYFLRTNPGRQLAKIANRRMSGALAESAVARIRRKEYLRAAGRLWKAFLHGANGRQLLSVVKRGFTIPSQHRASS
ncbi:MAG TPA: glycosyltransferase family A protein [Puia sp.]